MSVERHPVRCPNAGPGKNRPCYALLDPQSSNRLQPLRFGCARISSTGGWLARLVLVVPSVVVEVRLPALSSEVPDRDPPVVGGGESSL